VKYLIAWFGMMLLAIANGALRDIVYRQQVGDLAAHQISTVILLLLFSGYLWGFFTIWPLASAQQAWMVGVLWLAMTLMFEFGFGHWVAGQSWNQLLRAYHLHEGQLWLFIPLWVLVGPYVFFRFASVGVR
jgi:hypothetical protein